MAKLKYLILIIVLFVLSSCVEDFETTGEFSIINNSNQNITYIHYVSIEYIDSVQLDIGEPKIILLSGRGMIPSPPPIYGNSLIVYYNDTTQITHYNNESPTVSRNIFHKDSWQGGKVTEYVYKYEYIFTDSDYLEALDNQ